MCYGVVTRFFDFSPTQFSPLNKNIPATELLRVSPKGVFLSKTYRYAISGMDSYFGHSGEDVPIRQWQAEKEENLKRKGKIMTKKQVKSVKILIPQESIETKILFIRGKKVMLDHDLAVLYGVTTGNLNKAVKRNIERFPEDFMFQLKKEETGFIRFQFKSLKKGSNEVETKSLRFQSGSSKQGHGGRRYLPYVFTQEGVAMLSSVLNSDRAIQVNIQIMRTFTKLRALMATHKELRQKIEAMEKKYNYQFKMVFEAIKKLLEPPEKPKGKIGFHP